MVEATVEKALCQDIPVLNQISITAKMHWDYPLEWLHNWLETLRINREYLEANHVYKINSDRIFGFSAIARHKDHFEITHLWILPEFMGNGFGKRLLMETLKDVVTEKSEIIVESDPNAEKFYEKMGFKTFDQKESYPEGRYLPLMKRTFP